MSQFPWVVVASHLAMSLAGAQPEQLLQPRELGRPIRTANTISYRVAHGYGADGHDLLLRATTAESGGWFQALDLVTNELVSKPFGHLEGYPITLGRERRVFVGTSQGVIWRYDGRTQAWDRLAQPFDPTGGVNHCRAMDQGADGWLYCGSVRGERARVDPASGRVEPLPAPAEAGSWYVSAVQALPDGRVAFGFGHRARLLVYDPATRSDVGQWAPENWTADGFVINLARGETVLWATHFPNGQRGAFDIATGRWLGAAPWPPMLGIAKWSDWWHSSGYGSGIDFYVEPGTDTIVAKSGGDLYQWNPRQPDLPPHLPLDAWTPDPRLAKDLRYQITSEGEVWTYDLRRSRVVDTRTLDHPPVERGLMALGVGPDGMIYGGAYQSYQLFRYDPKQDKLETLGSYDPTWSGEPYSFTTRGPELIIASYTNGHAAAYDPSKPWECTAMQRRNPRVLGFFGQQVYRPFSVAAATDGRIWAVGPAGWGSTGAGVAWLDPATGKSHSTRLDRTPSDILPLPDNQLLLCDWDRLVWWDGTADKELAEAKLEVGIQGAVLLPGTPPRIAYVGGPVVVVASLPRPGQVEIEATSQGPIAGQHLQRYSRGVVVGGPQGFATCRLPEGVWRHLCSTPLGLRYAFVCHDDVVYFHRGSALMALAIPPEA